MAKNINQIKIQWKTAQSRFRAKIRHEESGRIGWAKRMIFLNQILAECEPEFEKMREVEIAMEKIFGKGRIEKQGYTAEPNAAKKYQWKFGFAHGIAQNDPEADLANSNEPRFAIIQECQRIKDGQQSQFEAENKL